MIDNTPSPLMSKADTFRALEATSVDGLYAIVDVKSRTASQIQGKVVAVFAASFFADAALEPIRKCLTELAQLADLSYRPNVEIVKVDAAGPASTPPRRFRGKRS